MKEEQSHYDLSLFPCSGMNVQYFHSLKTTCHMLKFSSLPRVYTYAYTVYFWEVQTCHAIFLKYFICVFAF